MRLGQNIKIGFWFLVSLNLTMAVGSIWVVRKISPTVDAILIKHQSSLEAFDDMLMVLAISNNIPYSELTEEKERFSKALDKIESLNKSEKDTALLSNIKNLYQSALGGNQNDIKEVVASIKKLNSMRLDAVKEATLRTKQFGNAAAWGIVFMASFLFVDSLIVRRMLKRHIIKPLEEIQSVTKAFKDGNTMRRCTSWDAPAEIRSIYSQINEILDRKTALMEKKFEETKRSES